MDRPKIIAAPILTTSGTPQFRAPVTKVVARQALASRRKGSKGPKNL